MQSEIGRARPSAALLGDDAHDVPFGDDAGDVAVAFVKHHHRADPARVQQRGDGATLSVGDAVKTRSPFPSGSGTQAWRSRPASFSRRRTST